MWWGLLAVQQVCSRYFGVLVALPEVNCGRPVQAEVFADGSVQVGHVVDGLVVQASVVLFQNLLDFVVQAFLAGKRKI